MRDLKNSKPSDVLIMRGLTADITEIMIQDCLRSLDATTEYIRLVKDKLTGIAIIKFQSVEEANIFMMENISLEINEVPVWVEFGFEHSNEDWTCKNCKNINFSSRKVCFKCGTSRSVASIDPPVNLNSGKEDISPLATRFLLLRLIDPSWSSQLIFDKIKIVESDLKRVWSVRNKTSKVSCEFCFLEFGTIESAKVLISRLRGLDIPFQIDGRNLEIHFGRDLDLLSQAFSFSGSVNMTITYWDPELEFTEYPQHCIVNPPLIKTETSTTSDTGAHLKQKSAFGAFSVVMNKPAPPKKLQVLLKKWSDKANNSEDSSQSQSQIASSFVPESSASSDKTTTKSKFLDLTFLSCLLCNVKFSTETELICHAQTSIDHAAKFEEYCKNELILDAEFNPEQYRDRASERRDAFCEKKEDIEKIIYAASTTVQYSHSHNQNHKQASIHVFNQDQESTSDQLPDVSIEYSIGAKLLKKMGWKEGKGLGKDGSGISEPLKAVTLEVSGSGIGASNLISAEKMAATTSNSRTTDTYIDKVKRDRNKRYYEE